MENGMERMMIVSGSEHADRKGRKARDANENVKTVFTNTFPILEILRYNFFPLFFFGTLSLPLLNRKSCTPLCSHLRVFFSRFSYYRIAAFFFVFFFHFPVEFT